MIYFGSLLSRTFRGGGGDHDLSQSQVLLDRHKNLAIEVALGRSKGQDRKVVRVAITLSDVTSNRYDMFVLFINGLC